MKRILIYSHDTFGLGNIRRMLEIARHLVRVSQDVSVLVLTGSPMLHAFRIPDRIDCIKLPCLVRDVHGRYGSRSLPLTLEQTVRLRANLIRSAMTDFAPDLVLVDKKPFGVEDELSGALESLPGTVPRPRMVLLLRDILDSPEATQRVWRKNRYYEAIDAYYDRVLVVGDPSVFDVCREYAFPAFTAAKVTYCGYIGREPGRMDRAARRSELGVDHHKPLLLVTPGGGEDGHAVIDRALKGLRALDDARRPRTHIVCGPEMREAQRHELQSRASRLAGVTVQEFSDDMMSLMAAADVVLAMGGYNTVCELLSAGCRGVLVPRTEPGVEQWIRAQRMSNLGLLRMVASENDEPSRLMDALLEEIHAAAVDLEQGHVARAERLPMPGLDGVAGNLFELIGLRVPPRCDAASRRRAWDASLSGVALQTEGRAPARHSGFAGVAQGSHAVCES